MPPRTLVRLDLDATNNLLLGADVLGKFQSEFFENLISKRLVFGLDVDLFSAHGHCSKLHGVQGFLDPAG